MSRLKLGQFCVFASGLLAIIRISMLGVEARYAGVGGPEMPGLKCMNASAPLTRIKAVPWIKSQTFI